VFQGNPDLLKSLERNKKELYYTSSDFWDSYRDLDMVCFYETKDRAFGFWKTRVCSELILLVSFANYP
jgi:hypothetical protein